ncbi:hypothetical protein [Pandoraea oxalativorans]|uniref:Ribosomal protein S3AE n=1 Tax=Pandoraea oxalativorans TaxID=573737 RepID=A0A0E3U8H5_9BURK|nr:hypothetical protein [Pandoraea oxalativorans]AKC71734.1 hypothetical protein MB84_23230 [Pandoraea oxalativorans]
MAAEIQIPIRTECPPGACTCEREMLLQDAQGDRRILMLTQAEEKRLIARIEAISSYGDLNRMIGLMHAQLGIRLRITPSPNEVKTLRGIIIQLDAQPGLCRKTRSNIPAAIRRCLDARPEIAYAILDSHDLLGGGH